MKKKRMISFCIGKLSEGWYGGPYEYKVVAALERFKVVRQLETFVMEEETSRNRKRTLVDQVQCEILGKTVEKTNIVKINSENLSTNGEICFPANLIAWRGLINNDSIDENCTNILEHYLRRKNYDTRKLSDENIVKKASEFLVNASETWPIQIQKCLLRKGRICIFLNKTCVIAAAIKEAVKQDKEYGKHVPNHNNIVIEINEDKDSDLTTVRLRLVKEVTEKLLLLQGYNITETNADQRYLCTTKSQGPLDERYRRCLCGVVKNQHTNTKETSETWETYVKKKIELLSSLVEAKSSELRLRSNLCNIAEAIVTFELLSVKPSRPVFIQSNSDSDKAISNCKGGSFVLYNAARIQAILEKFKKEESLGNYPNLLDINNIDFSQLNQEEEWELVYNFILGYPELIENCVNCESQLETSPQMLCLFLSQLCKKFSVYYRRIRILMEGRDHLIPTMMARLYLLQALQIVVNNSLAILNIVPVGEM